MILDSYNIVLINIYSIKYYNINKILSVLDVLSILIKLSVKLSVT